MSKRGSTGFGGDEERYGGRGEEIHPDDKPMKATAAQLAKRRIASLKKPGGARGRSGSPAVIPQVNGAASFGQSQPQQQAQNPFSSSQFGFSFGGPQAQNNGGSTFQFGVSAPGPSQQNGDNGGMFGQSQPAAPTFLSFNAGSTQPTTNGFNPSTSMFSQPPQTNNTPSFGGFGATRQNGTTPATTTTNTFPSFGGQTQNGTQNGGSGFTFGAQQAQKEPEAAKNPFASFSAPQKEAEKPAPTFGGFGATQPQQEKEKSSTPSFGGFGATQQEKDTSRASTPFGGLGATQSEKPSNAFGGGIFGQKQQESSDKPSTLFGQSQANGDKPSNPFSGFGQKQAESNDQATTSIGRFGATNGDKSQEKESSTAPANMFGGLGSKTNGESSATQEQEQKKSLFAFSQSQPASKPEQPATSLFSQPTQANGEKKGLFGAAAAPFDMPPSGGSVFDSLPKKDSTNGGKPLFSSADPSQVYREEDEEQTNESGATGGNSNIFGQSQQKSTILGASQPSKPTSSLFNFGNQTPSQRDTSMTTSNSNTTKDLFGSTNKAPAATSSTPAPSRSLFDRIDKDDMSKRLGSQEDSTKPTETPKAFMFGTDTDTPATAKPLFSSTSGTSSLFQKPADISEPQALKEPAKGLFQKPASQSATTAPLTPAPPAAAPVLFKAAPATAPTTRMAPPSQSTALAKTTTSIAATSNSHNSGIKQLNEGLISHLNSADPEQDWTSIFQYYMKAASKINGTPLPAEATAPITQAIEAPPPASNFLSRADSSATSGLLTAQTPKQPTAAGIFSKPPCTAPPATKKRPLEQDDESAAQPPATEKRVKPNEPVSYPKLPENASSTSKLFAAALDKSKNADTSKSATSSGFNPSTKSMFSASTTPASKPSSGGFVPTTSAGGTNFLASFGQAAKEAEDEERKKRKASDYDSEDEDEETWEKRDREEQAAKRAKLAEAAKGGSGFSFTASNDPPKTPAFKFGSSSLASTTPAAEPPKFNGLFGSLSKQQTPNEPGKLAPPGSSLFGPASSSVEASRATTPGATTDGEASTAADDGEPSDEVPNLAQGEDKTALLDSERESNEVLQEIDNAIIRKFAKKEGEEKPSFQTIGESRVYVLKDKASGKTRILSRVGMGKLVLNFQPLPKLTYAVHQKKDNLVIADFLDHINHSPAKMDRFYITMNSAAEAKELARVLTENAKK